MSLCTHKDIRRFDADHQIVISQVFDDMNFIQRTLHQPLCSDSMIFLHKFFLKRTTVYTNTNGYSSLLCHINHCFDSLCTADISGIDPDLICTVFHGCNSKTIIKMNICHKWYMDLFFDFLQCFCSFHSRYCTTDNITASLLQGVLVFLAALMLSMVLNMNSINFIMNQLVRWGVVALIVLFQPEIRRILEEVGSRRFIAFFSRAEAGTAVEQAIDQTVLACTEMSQSRTGALIVFERENLLDDMVRSGTVLDAAVSSELLKNIFFVKAPMHDGAVIVRNGRVLGAGCMLPLSKNVNLSRDLGMRHRAGIGMSENSDAVVVIVSEETGSISVAIGGMLKRHLKPETLENLLRNELLPREEDSEDRLKFNLLNLLRSKKNGGEEDA